jgi:hypothetical protein
MTPQSDALSALRDIHLPDTVGLWPLAPGWWLLAAALFALAIFFFARSRARRRSPARAALSLVEDLSQRFDEDHDTVALATGLSEVLRRIALVRFGRNSAAPLHGAARARSMTDAKGRNTVSPELIERLETVVYAGDRFKVEPDEEQRWIDAVRSFIQTRNPASAPALGGAGS